LIVGLRKKHTLTPTLSRKRERGRIFYLPLAGEGAYILSPACGRGGVYFISRLRERGRIFYLPLPLAGEGWGEGVLFTKPNNQLQPG